MQSPDTRLPEHRCDDMNTGATTETCISTESLAGALQMTFSLKVLTGLRIRCAHVSELNASVARRTKLHNILIAAWRRMLEFRRPVLRADHAKSPALEEFRCCKTGRRCDKRNRDRFMEFY